MIVSPHAQAEWRSRVLAYGNETNDYQRIGDVSEPFGRNVLFEYVGRWYIVTTFDVPNGHNEIVQVFMSEANARQVWADLFTEWNAALWLTSMAMALPHADEEEDGAP